MRVRDRRKSFLREFWGRRNRKNLTILFDLVRSAGCFGNGRFLNERQSCGSTISLWKLVRGATLEGESWCQSKASQTRKSSLLDSTAVFTLTLFLQGDGPPRTCWRMAWTVSGGKRRTTLVFDGCRRMFRSGVCWPSGVRVSGRLRA